MRLVIVAGALAVNGAKVAATDRTLHLKLGALQVVVITLMLCQDSVTATIRTLDKLFGAFAKMSERRVVWSFVLALLVWAAELQLLEILLRVSMHLNHLDWLVAFASFGARTAALSPRREASAAVGSVTVATLHWVYDNHRADGATEVL